jgi:mRNA interferase HigB
MRVVGKELLVMFGMSHSDAASAIASWLHEAEDAQWKRPLDVKQRYAHASMLSQNRVVFNLKGKDYRLLTTISYKHQVVFIERIGTHAEYSTWDFS